MTIKQKQCLLCYLGWYDGPMDGIWGEGSQNGTIAFQKAESLTVDGIFGPETEERILEVIAGSDGGWWEDIRFFSREEFACKCGQYCGGYPAPMQAALVRLADGARAYFGKPALVISGLRCQTHNANVGGVVNSRHLCGRAVDLKIQGVSADALLGYIKDQPGVRYAYKINATNVHFDI